MITWKKELATWIISTTIPRPVQVAFICIQASDLMKEYEEAP